jgi:hypothetical protein
MEDQVRCSATAIARDRLHLLCELVVARSQGIGPNQALLRLDDRLRE